MPCFVEICPFFYNLRTMTFYAIKINSDEIFNVHYKLIFLKNDWNSTLTNYRNWFHSENLRLTTLLHFGFCIK